MDRSKALEYINEALRSAKKDPKANALPGSDLLVDGGLDSLDALVFIMELSTATGKHFPEKGLEEQGFFKVDTLVDYLSAD